MTARERDMLYGMRGRHYGFVAPFRIMPCHVVAEAMGREESNRIFSDGCWPPPHAVDSLKETFTEKLQLVREFDCAEDVAVVKEPADYGEDRLMLGRGFKAVIDFLAEGLEVMTGDPVRSIDQSSGKVQLCLSSGKMLVAPFAILSVPTGAFLLFIVCIESHGFYFLHGFI